MIRFIRDAQPPNTQFKQGMVRDLGAVLNASFIASGDAVDAVEPDRAFPPAQRLLPAGVAAESPVPALTGTEVLQTRGVVSGAGRIRNPAKIRKMLAAIAASGLARKHIGWHGHSIVSGAGSDDNTPGSFSFAQMEIWRTNGIAAHVGRILNAAVGGSVGYGIETAANGHSTYFTAGGSASIAAAYGGAGVRGQSLQMQNSTATWQFLAKGSTVRVYGIASTSAVIPRYTVNGGAVQTAAAGTVATGSGTNVFIEFDITGLTAGDTIVLTGPTTSFWNATGVDLDAKSTAGLTIHRLSSSGNMGPETVGAYLDDTDTEPAGNWIGAAGSAGQLRREAQTATITTRLGLSGVLNMFDVNDLKGNLASGSAYGYTLADQSRHMSNYLANMAAKSLPVLLVLGPLRDPASSDTAGTPYTQRDIIDAYKALSDASTNCAYLDLTDCWASAPLATQYVEQQASGLIQDTVHPNKLGHAYFGTLVGNAILQAVGGV